MIATASFLRFTGVSRVQCWDHIAFLAYDTDIGKPHSENSCCETYVQYQSPYLSDQPRYILAFSWTKGEKQQHAEPVRSSLASYDVNEQRLHLKFSRFWK